MSYRISQDDYPGDPAFRVGFDPELERELGRWDRGRRGHWNGDFWSNPMFSIKREGELWAPRTAYVFCGSDMDADPLIH